MSTNDWTIAMGTSDLFGVQIFLLPYREDDEDDDLQDEFFMAHPDSFALSVHELEGGSHMVQFHDCGPRFAGLRLKGRMRALVREFVGDNEQPTSAFSSWETEPLTRVRVESCVAKFVQIARIASDEYWAQLYESNPDRDYEDFVTHMQS